MIRRLLSSLVGAILLGALALPAVAAPVRVYVNVPPPPIRVEVRGNPPGPDHVWIGGYHRWSGTEYVWVPGRWAARPHVHAKWVAGHWSKHARGWYWVEGHWR
jgi:YXWGXW repeat-containing protein